MAKSDDRLRELLKLVEKDYIKFGYSFYNDAGTGYTYSITYPNGGVKRLSGAQVDALVLGVRLAEAHLRPHDG